MTKTSKSDRPMLALTLLFRFTTSVCTTSTVSCGISQITEQQNCLVVVGCVFHALSSPQGGAINFAVMAQDVTINASSFLQCSASASTFGGSSGGACFLNWRSSLLFQCCALGCWATTQGNFVCCNGSGLRQSSVLGVAECAPRLHAEISRGGLHFDSNMTVTIGSLNLTDCFAGVSTCVSASGANGTSDITVSVMCNYSTFRNNSG
jgi:hypothetical protein